MDGLMVFYDGFGIAKEIVKVEYYCSFVWIYNYVCHCLRKTKRIMALSS